MRSASDSNKGIIDYKFYCFDGEPRFLYVSQGLENLSTAQISFLSLDWKFKPFVRKDYAHFQGLPRRPDSFDKMVCFAKEPSSGIPYVRVDFYDHKGCGLFSEMTFCPCSGLMPFDPPGYDLYVGNMLDLPLI